MPLLGLLQEDALVLSAVADSLKLAGKCDRYRRHLRLFGEYFQCEEDSHHAAGYKRFSSTGAMVTAVILRTSVLVILESITEETLFIHNLSTMRPSSG